MMTIIPLISFLMTCIHLPILLPVSLPCGFIHLSGERSHRPTSSAIRAHIPVLHTPIMSVYVDDGIGVPNTDLGGSSRGSQRSANRE